MKIFLYIWLKISYIIFEKVLFMPQNTDYTEQECREMLAMWLEAERKLASGGKEYRIGTRTLTRADMADINAAKTYWRKELAKFNGSTKVFRGVPRDF